MFVVSRFFRGARHPFAPADPTGLSGEIIVEFAPAFCALAPALIVLAHSEKYILLAAPVACEARAEGEGRDAKGEGRAHLETPHAIITKAATGPKALIASQTDWRSQSDSW